MMAQALGAEPSLSLPALWADTGHVHALLLDVPGRAVLPVSTPVVQGSYPALSPHRPGATWFERMVADLWGHAAVGGCDARPWLDHGHWGQTHPMALRPGPARRGPEPPEFLAVEDEVLHQLPLGPIHGDLGQPGHFRFTAQGEQVIRLETRLGYAHRGSLALLRDKSPRAAARFAARLSGDSTVAHAIAFARAAEAALETEPPRRAQALRAVMAELERIANHLGEAGALAAEAGFPVAPSRFAVQREAVRRANAIAFGHRLMMDCVVPGGVVADIVPGGAEAVSRAVAAVQSELPELAGVFTGHASLADRLTGTGVVSPALAVTFAAGGYVGRASERDFDARRWPGYPPYGEFPPVVPIRLEGDAAARIDIRLREIGESIRLVRDLLAALPDDGVASVLPPGSGEGIGVAEGFRGDVWHWLRLDNGMIASAFLRDPSWALWPVLEQVAPREEVAEFPLVERSLGASAAGVDL